MNTVERIRGFKGKTKVEMARALGITPQNYNSIEKRKLSVRNAKRIADVLGINAFELMGTDVLSMIPKTAHDKEILLAVIDSIQVEDDGNQERA